MHQPQGDISRQAALALRRELDRLKGVPEGNSVASQRALNRAAFRLGQLSGAGVMDRERIESVLELAGKKMGIPQVECWRQIEFGLRGGEQSPRKPLSL